MGKSIAPKNRERNLLHLGKGNRTARTYTGAGLTALAKIGLLRERLAVFHRKNAYRTVIYAFLAGFALRRVNRNQIHYSILLRVINHQHGFINYK
jgi:hypothetical protein